MSSPTRYALGSIAASVFYMTADAASAGWLVVAALALGLAWKYRNEA